MSKFVALGKEFGTSLTAKALNEAEVLWNRFDAEGKEQAKATFYKEAEDVYKEKQKKIAKDKEQERIKAKAEAEAKAKELAVAAEVKKE
jgi:hypothetical protein